jgi:hypothetical protein
MISVQRIQYGRIVKNDFRILLKCVRFLDWVAIHGGTGRYKVDILRGTVRMAGWTGWISPTKIIG